MPWLIGYPREKVNWSPTIDPEKCVKCGMCMNCGKKVFRWTENGPIVENPLDCVVGCTTCANLCLGNAISFPNIEELRELYCKQGIWGKVKKQLLKEGKLSIKKEVK